MTRVKYTIIFEKEFDLIPEFYPGVETTHEMIDIDIQGIKDDPIMFIDDDNVKMTVKAEVVEKSHEK